MRFYHNEIDLVEEVVKTAGVQFHQYYLAYAASHNLDIDELNRQHSERLQKLYDMDPVENSAPKISDLSGSLCGALVPFDSPPPTPPTEIEEKVHSSFHKLFKRLATKLHPDASAPHLSAEEIMDNLSLFREAKNALDNQKYFILLDIAERLRVTQPRNYKEQIVWMKNENLTLRSTLQQQKNTYNYYFAECETDEERRALARKFIAHLFGILVQ
jgi:hypothetical protein